jgi:serine/threonine-protein kinase
LRRCLSGIVILLLLTGCAVQQSSTIDLPQEIGTLRYIGEIAGEFSGRPLLSPQVIATDPAGNLYIADTGNNRIVKLGPDFRLITTTGGLGSDIGGLSRPVDIVSQEGVHFYVLDQGNRRILKLDYNLLFVDEFRFADHPELFTLGEVAGLAVSPRGKLYLTDPDNLRIIVMDSDFVFQRELRAGGGFSAGTEIAVSRTGGIYVYDEEEKTVFVFDPFGNIDYRIQPEDIGQLGGIEVIGRRIIATDKMRHELAIFDLSGDRQLSVGRLGTGSYHFNSPAGVVLRVDGRLFVADSGNNRIVYYEMLSE